MKPDTSLVIVLMFAFVIIECESIPVLAKNVSQINEECSKQTGISNDVAKNLTSTQQMPKPSETYYKFLECLYKRQNYFDDDGNVSYRNIENFLSNYYEKSILRKAMAPCEDLQVGTSLGERAYNAGSCIIKNLVTIEAQEDGESINSSEESANDI
uniref:Odorant binding protein 26 n=1 Tax=Holotrichia oblita TaxID=644536 RepID=A0A3Q8U6E9_HOLOL|nr:odorant binding protein 26 [Holotrichia oblita]